VVSGNDHFHLLTYQSLHQSFICFFNTGPQTRPEYQVNGGEFELDFLIKPVGI